MLARHDIDLILGNGVEVRGEIVNVSRVGMHLRVPVRFADGDVLRFRVHGCTSKGKVLYCRPDGDHYFMALSASGERRKEPRLSADEPVTLSVIYAEGTGRSIRGRLMDISKSGIGVICVSPIAVGCLVEIRADGGVLYGEVRNCTHMQGGGFRIGILAEEAFAGDLREKHFFSWGRTVQSYAARVWRGVGSSFSRHREHW